MLCMYRRTSSIHTCNIIRHLHLVHVAENLSSPGWGSAPPTVPRICAVQVRCMCTHCMHVVWMTNFVMGDALEAIGVLKRWTRARAVTPLSTYRRTRSIVRHLHK
jgi:hypothetical protein